MKNTIIIFSLLILFNCKKNEAVDSSSVSAMTVIEDENAVASLDNKTDASIVFKDKAVEISEPNSTSQKANIISKKVIRNGQMSIQVAEIKKAQKQVNEILKKSKAYIQSENFSNNDNAENLNLNIRVPHQNFDMLIDSFSDGVGSVLSKKISSDDVTEEYTDVSIKLENKKIYLEKYRNMLRSAKTIKDMLEIQENIRELEDEIDVSEGRLRFIDDRVNYSTLNLNLYKEKVRSSATSKIGFGSRFGDSITEGWNSFIAFFLGIISFWPFFLLIPIFIFVWKKWRKNRVKN